MPTVSFTQEGKISISICMKLMSQKGNAVVANKALANATEVAQVACKEYQPHLSSPKLRFIPSLVTSDPSGLLLGNPANETSSLGSHNNSSKIFTDQQLYIPRADSTGHQVGFTRDASSSEVTTKFVWYGHFLLVETESGEYTSLFYAKKTKQDGAYSLQWNITDDDETEFVSVSMRSIAPSNA